MTDDTRPARRTCEICDAELNPRRFPNLTHGKRVCSPCSEKVQADYIRRNR